MMLFVLSFGSATAWANIISASLPCSSPCSCTLKPHICSPAAAVEDIDAHIAELEHRISHDSLSLNEEKKVLEQIKALKKSRRWDAQSSMWGGFVGEQATTTVRLKAVAGACAGGKPALRVAFQCRATEHRS